MATAAGGRLIAAAAAVAATKNQNRCLGLSSPHPEIKFSTSKIALRADLRLPVPIPLSLSLRHFPSKFTARDRYSGSNEEEEEEEEEEDDDDDDDDEEVEVAVGEDEDEDEEEEEEEEDDDDDEEVEVVGGEDEEEEEEEEEDDDDDDEEVEVVAGEDEEDDDDDEEEEEEEEEDIDDEQQNVEERDGQQQLVENARSSSGETGRLYVGNLPFVMNSSEIAEIFGQAGNVVAVELITNRVNNRSRGFAFVTMASDREANEAIRMFDGAQFGGRTAKVNFPEVPKGGERLIRESKVKGRARSNANSPYKIYVGNLGWTVTSDMLRNAFSACSGVVGANVVYERDTGRSRGFGFVAFASNDECQAALETMDGKTVANRPMRLSPASGKSRSAVQSKAADTIFLEGNGQDADVDQESLLESSLV